MENKPVVIATVINDVLYDQRMIRICTSLSADYEVCLWGRKKSNQAIIPRNYKQKRFSFPIHKGVAFYMLYNIVVFANLLKAKFDIIHAVDLDTLPAAFFASKLRGKKLVYDSHEYFTEVPELINRPRKRSVWLAIERYILPKVKNALTVGPKIAEEYKKLYSVDFKVVRNCPVLKDLPAKTSNQKYLIYQGALNKGRGLEATIKAMQWIPIELKIAGSGDLDAELHELVKEYKVEDKVTFLGMLKPEELPELTANAFAGINISENLGLSYYYSLNNKCFDYIHAGLPAITNPFPEYEAINDTYNCFTFATAESQEIANAVNLLLADTDKYEELRRNCILARAQLTWENEEQRLLEVYADLS